MGVMGTTSVFYFYSVHIHMYARRFKTRVSRTSNGQQVPEWLKTKNQSDNGRPWQDLDSLRLCTASVLQAGPRPATAKTVGVE